MKEEGDTVGGALGLELVSHVVQKFWIIKKTSAAGSVEPARFSRFHLSKCFETTE